MEHATSAAVLADMNVPPPPDPVRPPFVAQPLATYVRELKSALPADAFEPEPARVLLVPLLYGMSAVAAIAIVAGWVPWPIAALLSVGIGVCIAILGFVAHEVLHGAVVKGRRLKHVVGFFGFLPFCLSPRLWNAWHGGVHHGNANSPGHDPDGYPMLPEYHAERRVQLFIDWFTPGGRRLRGLLCFLFGFTGQSTLVLLMSRRRGYLTARARRVAIAETLLGYAIWATVAVLVGFVPFLLIYVVPMLVGNTIMMAFILTNHSLSPLTEINDPLINSLTVTGPRWQMWTTLNFGLHVEHHLFPAMSSRRAPEVTRLLRERWPERYQSMPFWRALLALHRTGRVYKDPVTLIDPKTGAEFPTLLPATPATIRE